MAYSYCQEPQPDVIHPLNPLISQLDCDPTIMSAPNFVSASTNHWQRELPSPWTIDSANIPHQGRNNILDCNRADVSPHLESAYHILAERKPVFEQGDLGNEPSGKDAKGAFLWRVCIRADCIEYLTASFPRLNKEGLWHQDHQGFIESRSHRNTNYGRLADVYSCVCRLETRMEDDSVRNKAALMLLHIRYEEFAQISNKQTRGMSGTESSNVGVGVTSRGRGYASLMVDSILSEMHPEWPACGNSRKSELRAKFHDKKRYGKRWTILADHLGPGILFICSRRLEMVV